jgi:hypothetical protein
MLKRATIVVVSAVGAAVFLAGPASAEPGDNPCDLAVNFLCRFVPIAPDVEDNVDLTQLQPPFDPNAPLPESLPPLDPCSAGCI